MKAENKAEKKTNTITAGGVILNIFCILLMTAGVAAMTYLLNKPVAEMIRESVSFLTGLLAVLFLWYQSWLGDSLDYDNRRFPSRFFLICIPCFLLSVCMIFLPVSSWVFMPMMTFLSLYSNDMIGLATGSSLLMVTVLMAENGSLPVFFLYFLSGLVGIALFRRLDIRFQITVPLVLSSAWSFLLQVTYLVIFENKVFSPELFLMPLLNLFVTVVLLFVILKFFSRSRMYQIQDKYADINDPEFPLFAAMKQQKKELYYHCLHTAYISDRIAKQLQINDRAVKGSAYYFPLLKPENAMEDIDFNAYYETFPEEMKAVMTECANDVFGSRESCVVLTAHRIIGSFLAAIRDFPDKELPHDAIIRHVFAKLTEEDRLKDCEISFRELHLMQAAFTREKLYYDFLR